MDTKKTIKKRDGNKCFFCGSTENLTIGHIVPKENKGLGIEENGITICGNALDTKSCHNLFDFTEKRTEMLEKVMDYFPKRYPGWKISDLIFRKKTKK